MLGEHHDNLAVEFPEFKDKIHQLKENDEHFNQVLEEYQKLDREIWGIEEGEESPSDAYVEQQKKKRALLKDELYALLKRN